MQLTTVSQKEEKKKEGKGEKKTNYLLGTRKKKKYPFFSGNMLLDGLDAAKPSLFPSLFLP